MGALSRLILYRSRIYRRPEKDLYFKIYITQKLRRLGRLREKKQISLEKKNLIVSLDRKESQKN